MIVLGIDPGSSLVGYGIVENEKNKIRCLEYGTIEPIEKEQSQRLVFIFNKVKEVIKKFKPEFVVVEELFFFKNQKTGIRVAEARGVIVLACSLANVPVIKLGPLEVKKAISGYGMADKSGIQKIVRMLLNLEEIPKPDDAADALALAICGLGHSRLL